MCVWGGGIACNLLTHITDQRAKAAAWSPRLRPPWWHIEPCRGFKTHTLTQTEANFVQERKTLTVAIEMFHGARRSQGEIEEEEKEGYREG